MISQNRAGLHPEIANVVGVAQKMYMNSLGLWVVLRLAFVFFTGLYLFVLPYAIR